MKLFLASAVKDPRTMEKLETYVGGFKGKSIAYIPTASNGEEGWEVWKNKPHGSWSMVNSLESKVVPVVLEEYRDDSVIKILTGHDIIWFAGGYPGYLMYWIRRCKIDLNIRKILGDKAIYVGSSAGAMVAGQTLQVATWKQLDGERGAENLEPMKLVDFDIFPHYEDHFYDEIKDKYSGPKIYLLKDGEEIVVEDEKVKVIGEKRIIANV